MKLLSRGLYWVLRVLLALVAIVAILWVTGALFYDSPWPALRKPLAIIWFLGAVVAWFWIRPRMISRVVVLVAMAAVLGWWLTLQPRDDRDWQEYMSQAPWAEVHGDVIILHNFRHTAYRTYTDYTPHWETRTVNLAKLTGIDIGMDYWGSEWIAHPVVSFQFSDTLPVAFSIETRREKPEGYSAIGGLYRQYELLYVVGDERDLFGIRAIHSPKNTMYLYRTKTTPEKARERFMEYINAMNKLKEHPRWYNAATTNCTTTVRTQRPMTNRTPWDWRILFNGKLDEMMYEQNAIATDGLPFPELKKSAAINEAARAVGDSPEFSRLIRESRPGFQ
ncbi:uncharacterized protein DUF4105 [Roseimicrobium gellanilyticum]|uniref:Uncharacterized protein DUF4105 n=1 Tax=Roseimicrobium gellanilyticum TaxID=748857 RepID=A0A366HQI9_9BACT|nr:DUF4105 domain-containing protein [Roseimicrobium gellanilyticum]RBP45058.1 uncharacterized protein DUF4105 [Roseimicrobium gellanilyticum]